MSSQDYYDELKRQAGLGIAPPEDDTGLIGATLRGAYTGIRRRLPEQLGQAGEFLGIGGAEKLTEWAREGEVKRDIDPWTVKGALETGAEQLAPSMLLPLGLGIAAKALAIPKALALVGQLIQPSIFGLSQARQTEETAQKQGIDPGAAPWLTGSIDALGETIANAGLMYALGPLAKPAKLAMDSTVKSRLKPTVGTMLKRWAAVTIPTEVATEMMQQAGEAGVEKAYGIGDHPDITKETLSVIPPTIAMTMMTMGLAHPVQRYVENRNVKTISQPVNGVSGFEARPYLDENGQQQIDLMPVFSNPADGQDPAKIEQAQAAVAKRMQIAKFLSSSTAGENADAEQTKLAQTWDSYATNKILQNEPIDPDLTMDSMSMAIEDSISKVSNDLGTKQDFVNTPMAIDYRGRLVEAEQLRADMETQHSQLINGMLNTYSWAQKQSALKEAGQEYDPAIDNLTESQLLQLKLDNQALSDKSRVQPVRTVGPAPEELPIRQGQQAPDLKVGKDEEGNALLKYSTNINGKTVKRKITIPVKEDIGKNLDTADAQLLRSDIGQIAAGITRRNPAFVRPDNKVPEDVVMLVKQNYARAQAAGVVTKAEQAVIDGWLKSVKPQKVVKEVPVTTQRAQKQIFIETNGLADPVSKGLESEYIKARTWMVDNSEQKHMQTKMGSRTAKYDYQLDYMTQDFHDSLVKATEDAYEGSAHGRVITKAEYDKARAWLRDHPVTVVPEMSLAEKQNFVANVYKMEPTDAGYQDAVNEAGGQTGDVMRLGKTRGYYNSEEEAQAAIEAFRRKYGPIYNGKDEEVKFEPLQVGGTIKNGKWVGRRTDEKSILREKQDELREKIRKETEEKSEQSKERFKKWSEDFFKERQKQRQKQGKSEQEPRVSQEEYQARRDKALAEAKKGRATPEYRVLMTGADPEFYGTTHEEVAKLAKYLGLAYRWDKNAKKEGPKQEEKKKEEPKQEKAAPKQEEAKQGTTSASSQAENVAPGANVKAEAESLAIEAPQSLEDKYRAEAERLGIKFDGVQERPGNKPAILNFTDPQTKGTFQIYDGGAKTVEQRRDEKREEFRAAEEARKLEEKRKAEEVASAEKAEAEKGKEAVIPGKSFTPKIQAMRESAQGVLQIIRDYQDNHPNKSVAMTILNFISGPKKDQARRNIIAYLGDMNRVPAQSESTTETVQAAVTKWLQDPNYRLPAAAPAPKAEPKGKAPSSPKPAKPAGPVIKTLYDRLKAGGGVIIQDFSRKDAVQQNKRAAFILVSADKHKGMTWDNWRAVLETEGWTVPESIEDAIRDMNTILTPEVNAERGISPEEEAIEREVADAYANGWRDRMLDEMQNLADQEKNLESDAPIDDKAVNDVIDFFDKVGNAVESEAAEVESGNENLAKSVNDGVEAEAEAANDILGKGDMVKVGESGFGMILSIKGNIARIRMKGMDAKSFVEVRTSRLQKVSQMMMIMGEALSAASNLDPVKGKLNSNTAQLVQLLGDQYAQNLAEVTIKELIQNAFDAIKASTYSQPGHIGKVSIRINTTDRSITVKDNGPGMDLSTVEKAFFTIGGSEKNVPPELRSGGLGLAKLAFIAGAERIRLVTTKNGVTTTTDAKTEDIKNDNFSHQLSKAKAKAVGTEVTVWLPSERIDIKTGEKRHVNFPYSASNVSSFLNKPLIGPGEFTLDFDGSKAVLPMGKNFVPGDTQFATKAEFSWGTADIYFGKQHEKYPKHYILSSGLFQFQKSFQRNFESLPYNIIVNVKPSVEATHPDYPFTNNREGFKERVEKDITALSKYLTLLSQGNEAQSLKDNFKDMKTLPRIEDVGAGIFDEMDARTEEKYQKDLERILAENYKKDEDKPASGGEKADIPELIKILKDLGGVVDGVTGKTVISQENLKESSFRAEKEAPRLSDFMIDVNHDPKDPLFHNNLNVDLTRGIPDAPAFFAELGTLFTEMKEAMGESHIYQYNKLNDLFFAGISLDKGYGGLHIRVPYKAMFLNPFYNIGYRPSTPFGVIDQWYRTMVHELAHTGDMGHGEQHNAEEFAVNGFLADKGKKQYFEAILTDIYYRHEKAFTQMRDRYDESTTVNTSKGLKEFEGQEAANPQGEMGRAAIRTAYGENAVPGRERPENVSDLLWDYQSGGASGSLREGGGQLPLETVDMFGNEDEQGDMFTPEERLQQLQESLRSKAPTARVQVETAKKEEQGQLFKISESDTQPQRDNKIIGNLLLKFGLTGVHKISDVIAEIPDFHYDEIMKKAEELGTTISFDVNLMTSAQNQKYAIGVFDRRTNQIVVNLQNVVRAGDAYYRLKEVLAHEGIHSVVENLPDEGWFDVHNLLDDFANDLEKYRYLVNDPLTGRMYDLYVTQMGQGFEILNLGLTNKGFAAWLDSIPASGNKNESQTMWGRLKQIILNLIGAATKTGRTKLDELNDIMDQVMEVHKADAVDDVEWEAFSKQYRVPVKFDQAPMLDPELVRSFKNITAKMREGDLSAVDKEALQEARDFAAMDENWGWWRRYISMPYWNAKKNHFWQQAFATFGNRRPENRSRMTAELVKEVDAFIGIKDKQRRERIWKALIAGDALSDEEFRKLDGESKGKMKELNRYTDEQLRSQFGFDDKDISTYALVRKTLDSITERQMQFLEQLALEKYKSQKWYEVLEAAHGVQLTDATLSKILSGGLKRLGTLKSRSIAPRIGKIFANLDRGIEGLPEKEAQDATKAYRGLYTKMANDINGIKAVLKEMSPELTDAQLNAETQDIIKAYMQTRPELRKIRELRAHVSKSAMYFPRSRDKAKYQAKIFVAEKDKEGKDVDREVFMQFYDTPTDYMAIRKEALQDKQFSDDGKTFKPGYRMIMEKPQVTGEWAFFGTNDAGMMMIINNAIDKLKIGEKDPELFEKIRGPLYEQIANEFKQRGFGGHMIRRQKELVKGYKTTDLDKVLTDYITGFSGMITKQQAAREFVELMSEMRETSKDARLYEDLAKYGKDNLRNEEAVDRMANGARAFAYIWFLGGIIRPAAVQVTQNFVTGVPQYGKWLRANKVALKQHGLWHGWLGTAEKDYTKAMIDIGKGGKQFKGLPDIEKRMEMELLAEGVTMAQYTRDIINRTLPQMSQIMAKTARIVSIPFAGMEMFNRQSAALTMFRASYALLTKQGMDSETAYGVAVNDARNFINDTHYYAGKANYPQIAAGGDLASGAIRTALTFRSFTHNYLLWLSTDADKWAVLHSLAYIAMFGGLSALPFMKDLMELIEKQFGYSPKTMVAKALRQAGGKTLEEFGLYGLPAAILGTNLSGSLAIGIPFVGENPMATLTGVGGSLIQSEGRALEALKRGAVGKAMVYGLPQMLSMPAAAMQQSQTGKELFGTPGMATTPRGEVMYDQNGKPMQLKDWAVATKFFGFNPEQTAYVSNQAQTAKRLETFFKDWSSSINATYQIAKTSGDKKALPDLMKAIQKYNDARRDRDVMDLVSRKTLHDAISASRAGVPKGQVKKRVQYENRTLSPSPI